MLFMCSKIIHSYWLHFPSLCGCATWWKEREILLIKKEVPRIKRIGFDNVPDASVWNQWKWLWIRFYTKTWVTWWPDVPEPWVILILVFIFVPILNTLIWHEVVKGSEINRHKLLSLVHIQPSFTHAAGSVSDWAHEISRNLNRSLWYLLTLTVHALLSPELTQTLHFVLGGSEDQVWSYWLGRVCNSTSHAAQVPVQVWKQLYN